MIDPQNIVDAHGLSVDSLRGSETMIRPDLVGNESIANPLDPSRHFGRSPLSYHEARTLQLRGVDVADDAMYPEVLETNQRMAEILPDPTRNDVQMQSLPAIQDPEYQAWKREKERVSAQEMKEYQDWKRNQESGRSAPPLTTVQDSTSDLPDPEGQRYADMEPPRVNPRADTTPTNPSAAPTPGTTPDAHPSIPPYGSQSGEARG